MSEPSPTLRLKAIAGNASGTQLEIEEELRIGRGAEGDGQLAGDIEISREHARIWRAQDSGYYVEDLGSTNGTILNGRQVTAAEALAVGDRIEIGQTVLVVQYTSVSEPGLDEPAPSAEVPADTAAADALPAESSGTPRLSLQLEVDPEAGEVLLRLADGSDSVKFVQEDGRWRIDPAP